MSLHSSFVKQLNDRTVNLKNESYPKLHIGDFSKLMAKEAVYHKGCHVITKNDLILNSTPENRL